MINQAVIVSCCHHELCRSDSGLYSEHALNFPFAAYLSCVLFIEVTFIFIPKILGLWFHLHVCLPIDSASLCLDWNFINIFL